jgi:hypothetical protein
MADRPLDLYLNDHMGGATLGSDLAGQIRDRNEGTPLGDAMDGIAADIEEDRQALHDLMDALDVSRNPVKKAGGWAAEKLSRVKFSGAGSGDAEHGNFMALESLRLGVAGKRCLWVALQSVEDRYEAIRAAGMDRLLERANGQIETLERLRIQAATELLGSLD